MTYVIAILLGLAFSGDPNLNENLSKMISGESSVAEGKVPGLNCCHLPEGSGGGLLNNTNPGSEILQDKADGAR